MIDTNPPSRKLPGWQARLTDFLRANHRRTFAPGKWDCAIWAAGAVEAMTSGLNDTATAADGAGGAARDAGAAAAAAGTAAAEGAATAVSGWQAVTAALADYAARARDIGGDIGSALVGAFTAAETAIGDFVKTGKLDFRDLVTSLIADLAKLAARRFILGPIANALAGVFGGTFGGVFGGAGAGLATAASVLHGGGLVGQAGSTRRVPALAFAGAPRLHNGGWAGLRPDEVPAILQRGERVLSRREAASSGIAAPAVLELRLDPDLEARWLGRSAAQAVRIVQAAEGAQRRGWGAAARRFDERGTSG